MVYIWQKYVYMAKVRIYMARMAAGRRFLLCTISSLVYVFLCLYKVSFTSYSQLSAGLDCRITFRGYLQSPKRNISFSTWTFQPRGRYLSARISLYPNHEASFTLSRISISGDVESNPGPAINSKIITLCYVCHKNVRIYNRAIECDVCKHWCHIKCGEISRIPTIAKHTEFRLDLSILCIYPKNFTFC